MKTVNELPQGYAEILSVDLQKNKRLALLVNAAAILIGVALGVAGHFCVPITALFDMSAGIVPYLVRFAVLAVASVAYILLHELVHGITMKLFGCPKVKYGFTGLYAFAGSDAYFGKTAYLAVALAPVVLWGIVLAVLCAVLPASWFWVAYIVQISNLSGAAGDLYVTLKFLGLPKDILVRDVGVSMTVYAPQTIA